MGTFCFPHLTVAQNTGYGLHGWPREQRVARVVEVLSRLGLADLARRYPRELSGGQQQRVALGRALAPDPAILLLDEPLSALDAPLRRQLRGELVATLQDWGKTTVLVTHDVAEAYELADQIVVYDGGRVLQSAARRDAIRRPSSEAVARIMGMRNILEGRWSGRRQSASGFSGVNRCSRLPTLPARPSCRRPDRPCPLSCDRSSFA